MHSKWAMLLFFKNYLLAEFTYLQIRLHLTNPVLGNTEKTDSNKFNEKNIQIKITLERVSKNENSLFHNNPLFYPSLSVGKN